MIFAVITLCVSIEIKFYDTRRDHDSTVDNSFHQFFKISKLIFEREIISEKRTFEVFMATVILPYMSCILRNARTVFNYVIALLLSRYVYVNVHVLSCQKHCIILISVYYYICVILIHVGKGVRTVCVI